MLDHPSRHAPNVCAQKFFSRLGILCPATTRRRHQVAHVLTTLPELPRSGSEHGEWKLQRPSMLEGTSAAFITAGSTKAVVFAPAKKACRPCDNAWTTKIGKKRDVHATTAGRRGRRRTVDDAGVPPPKF